MSNEYQKCLETLELDRNAGQDEIKRAYFRMVRQHPPEKDPERFQQIRHAYEVLKAGPQTQREESFPPPDDQVARFFIEYAEKALGAGDYANAADCYSEALKIVRDDPFLLLNLAQAQLDAGNPRKAAKTAQRLAELKPDFADAHAIAAMGMFEGGWYKKALPEYRKAYELGRRDAEFLTDYADDLQANDLLDEAGKLRDEILSGTKWDKDNVEQMMYLYQRQVQAHWRREEKLVSLLREYKKFMKANRRIARNQGLGVLVPFGDLLMSGMEDRSQELYLELDELAAMTAKLDGGEFEEKLNGVRVQMILNRMEEDEEFSDTLWLQFLTTLCPMDDRETERLQRYGALDVMLCMNKEREETRRQLERIREKYPFYYELACEPLSVIFEENNEAKIEIMRQEYDRLCEDYEGGEFYNRYPEEKRLAKGTLAYSGGTPFVRETKKPGRNDPCPCGSGKKFKKCCIGKGVYD